MSGVGFLARVRTLGLSRTVLDRDAIALGAAVATSAPYELHVGTTLVAMAVAGGTVDFVLVEPRPTPASPCTATLAWVSQGGAAHRVLDGVGLWVGAPLLSKAGALRVRVGPEPSELRLHVTDGSAKVLVVWQPSSGSANECAYVGTVDGWLVPTPARLEAERHVRPAGPGPGEPQPQPGGRALGVDLDEGVAGRDDWGRS